MDETTAPGYLSIRVQVRWGECDPAGIAFYPRFFEWMDLISHRLARELGLPPSEFVPPGQLGFPLVSAQAEFLQPARLDDNVEVRAWITRVGRTSFGVRHEIVRLGETETLLARGREDRVHIERDPDGGGMRPRPFTDEMRRILARYADPLAA